jgi:membrane associated rhomboid family serine protease
MKISSDQNYSRGRFPRITTSLIVVNVVVYIIQVLVGAPFTYGYSLVPEEIVTGQDIQGNHNQKIKHVVGNRLDPRGHQRWRFDTPYVPIKHYPGPYPTVLTLFTSIFMHTNGLSLGGNMLFLLAFGRRVECVMSSGRFLMLYLACGAVGGLAQVVSDPHSIIPCMGPSGAIAGVLAAYLFIQPCNQFKVWLGNFAGVIEVPTLFIVGFWVVWQYSTASTLIDQHGYHDGVAYGALLGGFAAGFVIIRVIFYWSSRQTQRDGAEAEKWPTMDQPARVDGSAASASVSDAGTLLSIHVGARDDHFTPPTRRT